MNQVEPTGDRPHTAAVIRQIVLEDAERYLTFRRKLFSETKFMLIEPTEIAEISIEQQNSRLAKVLSQQNARIFVAETDKEIVGFLSVSGGELQRTAHCGYIVVGVLEAHSKKGIATQLFNELESWAPSAGVARLELTVMVHNKRALRLYQQRGFQIEGTKKSSVRIDGRDIDEHVMGKLVP